MLHSEPDPAIVTASGLEWWVWTNTWNEAASSQFMTPSTLVVPHCSFWWINRNSGFSESSLSFCWYLSTVSLPLFDHWILEDSSDFSHESQRSRGRYTQDTSVDNRNKITFLLNLKQQANHYLTGYLGSEFLSHLP